jgi:hypothetical protein
MYVHHIATIALIGTLSHECAVVLCVYPITFGFLICRVVVARVVPSHRHVGHVSFALEEGSLCHRLFFISRSIVCLS